jgi:Ca2+-binding EF-hand superfamily protein
MAELNLIKLRAAFKIYNLTERDYITADELIILLTKLND